MDRSSARSLGKFVNADGGFSIRALRPWMITSAEHPREASRWHGRQRRSDGTSARRRKCERPRCRTAVGGSSHSATHPRAVLRDPPRPPRFPHKSALSAAKMLAPPASSLPRLSPSSSWSGAQSPARRGAIRVIRKIRRIRFPLLGFSGALARRPRAKRGRGFNGSCRFDGSAPWGA